MSTLRNATLLFLLRRDGGKVSSLCLAMKKRGFGVGRWNGTGGKVEKGESIAEAAVRETTEEIGVVPRKLEKIGTITFHFTEHSAFNQLVHVYVSESWEGEPRETEEMRPEWFRTEDIPYDAMWPDDRYWLPLLIEGKAFTAEFTFGAGDNIVTQEVRAV